MQPMFCYRAFILFLALLPLSAAAQEIKPETSSDYSTEAVVIEHSLTNLTFENDGTGTREQSTRIRIQSQTGVQQFGILTIGYQSATESLQVDYVRALKPDGSVIATPLDSIQDMPSSITQAAPFYSDLREKHIAVKGLSVGDILEFHVHWQTTKPLAPGQFWYGYDFNNESIILDEQLQISVPATREVKWQSRELKPTITQNNGSKIFAWKSSNLSRKSASQRDEDQDKNAYKLARGQLAPPDVLISSFQSWEEVGRWYDSLQSDRVKPSPEIQAKAAELTKGLTTNDAKIRAIYKFVSAQFRYIGVAFGIGRYQPHSAAEILANQYGDCKDKHTLLASLLDAAGIPAYPALINSSHALELDVPSPMQFDHVISVVPQDKDLLWLDTTPEIAPYGLIMPSLRDKLALVMFAGKDPKLVRTPANPPFQNSTKFSADGTLSDAGVLDAQMEETSRGEEEILLRSVFRQVSVAQWNQLMQNISYRLGFAGTVTDTVATQPDDTDQPFNFKYTYHREDYSDWEHKRITFPFPPLGLPTLRGNQAELVAPVWLGTTGEAEFVGTVKLPKGYTPAVPSNVQVAFDFAEYNATYSLNNGVLKCDRKLLIKLHEVPTTEFKQYKSFLKSIGDDWDDYVVLSTSSGNSLANTNPMAALWEKINSLPFSDKNAKC
jgi:hypothetical protein